MSGFTSDGGHAEYMYTPRSGASGQLIFVSSIHPNFLFVLDLIQLWLVFLKVRPSTLHMPK